LSSKNCRVWDFTRQQFATSRDLIFLETVYPTADNFKASIIIDLDESKLQQLPRISIESINPAPKEPETSTPEARPIYDTIVVEKPPPPEIYSAVHESNSNTYSNDPLSYEDAVSRQDARQWLLAMKSELDSIQSNKTWELCYLPPGRKVIGSKWVFKTKRDGNNNFERYKARICAKGYSQVAGLDFEETFTPVVRIESVRALLAIAAFFNLYILHVDCKTAFLNGNSDLELYIQQPEGFINPKYPQKVLQLNKSLYGLKQAPRIWYLLLCSQIFNLGFQSCGSDSSIYYSPTQRIILAVYVNDILIFGKLKTACDSIYQALSKQFRMEYLGPPKTFLGLNIVRTATTISINQSGYIDRMLTRFKMSTCSPIHTPLNASLPLQKAQDSDKGADQTNYQELIGSLNHLAVYSRPDISFAVSKLSQFNSDPTTTHFRAAQHILRYLQATKDISITYGTSKDLTANRFADADWGSDRDDRKSVTGYVFMINNGPVSWTSHKQSTVATSTMEAEYMALSDASREVIARQQLFTDLNISIPIPRVYSDNQAALAIAQNPVHHQHSKHIDIRYHFIRHAVQNDQLIIDYVPTAAQTADLLTKALGPQAHARCIQGLFNAKENKGGNVGI
jgi:hypothetical protein